MIFFSDRRGLLGCCGFDVCGNIVAVIVNVRLLVTASYSLAVTGSLIPHTSQ